MIEPTAFAVSPQGLEAAQDLERQAARLRALGDPVRLRIVAILGAEGHCVCELQAALGGIGPSLLSYHLGVLRQAGLVQARRRGRWIDYRLTPGVREELCRTLRAPWGPSVGTGRGEPGACPAPPLGSGRP